MKRIEAERRLGLIREGQQEKALTFINSDIFNNFDIRFDEEYKKNYLDTYKIYRYEWKMIALKDLKVFYISEEGKLLFISLEDTIAYKTIILNQQIENGKGDPWWDYVVYTDRLREKDLNLIHTKERFQHLIHELEQKGFDEKYPVLTDEDNRILDGQHRAVWLAGKLGLDAQVKVLRLYILNDDKYDFFPFEKIERGSRIIIYGAGNFGESYIEQLDETGYATVTALLDRNALKWNEDIRKKERIICCFPDEINRFLGQYDYVVIASRSRRHVWEMKDFIIREGVGIEKIVAYF